MNLETQMLIWKREAKAHGYAGFLVIGVYEGYDRVFLHSASELEPALNSMRVHGKNVVHQEML